MGYMIGKYEVVEKLGSGAMGEVFKARNPKNNQYVAIKMLSEELSNKPKDVERFKREIEQAKRLKHPNLIIAYSHGSYRGRHYYVMEYVEGITAKKELLTRGVYDEFRAWEIILQICKALAYAANAGVIHRDIKPDNIMITYDGKAKLCDMGLAKTTAESGTRLTVLGTVLGTPHYMSPEQAQGKEDLDTRSDIFSLGATTYHVLTGSPPFEGNDLLDIMKALIEKEPLPIQDRNPKISEATCSIVAMMMTKDRSKRYQNFTEVMEDIYRLKRGEITEAQKTVSLPKSRLKQQKFVECFVPEEEDVLVGQIALYNKMLTVEKISACLIRQEVFALMGAKFTINDIMLEMGLITAQQKLLLDKTKLQVRLNRLDDLFIKICNSNNFLSDKQKLDIQKLRKKKRKGIGAIIYSPKFMPSDKRNKITAAIKSSIRGEENKSLLKTALDAKLISKPQADKCLRIYSNNAVMGRYKDIGAIIMEKEFLAPQTYKALLRAVRKSLITNKPIVEYLNEVKQ